eukprot:gene1362-1963_t
MPFMGQEACDDFKSGQEAALAGGTTMHIDFALPVNGDLAAGFELYKKKSAKSVMDFGFHMAVTAWNDQVAEDMSTLAKLGINSFKFFLAYKGALMVTDEEFQQGLQQCKKIGAVAMVHAENGDAVANGQKAMIEKGIVGPEGHALSRPAVLEADFRTLPNGVNGIEERMHVTWDVLVNSGRISPSAYVSITSAEAAKVFNIFPQKGHIAPGSDADVIIFDPTVEHTISATTHHSRMDTNIYEGYTMKGKVVTTISQGNIVWENEKLNTVEGAGRYIKMEPFGYLFDELDKLEPAPKPYGPTPVPRDYGSSENKDEL